METLYNFVWFLVMLILGMRGSINEYDNTDGGIGFIFFLINIGLIVLGLVGSIYEFINLLQNHITLII